MILRGGRHLHTEFVFESWREVDMRPMVMLLVVELTRWREAGTDDDGGRRVPDIDAGRENGVVSLAKSLSDE